MEERVLQDTPHRRVVRVGDTVRRPVHEWSAGVHSLLLHLEAVGFEAAPRFLGIDEQGREVLTWLDGESGPDSWAHVVPSSGLVAMARLLRSYHEAVRDFRPPAGVGWAGHDGRISAGELICHGDFGPWNLVWRGGAPVGILDWDYAWPQRPLHDVAYALEYVAPFRDDATCVRWLRYPGPPDRRRRIGVFAEAYGLSDLSGLVSAVIAQQDLVWRRTRRLAAEGRQPQVEWQRAGVLDETAERIAWSRAHRHLLE